MSDIVERLRWSGQDALTRHLSLGMAKLHAEAADEIERLRAILWNAALALGSDDSSTFRRHIGLDGESGDSGKEAENDK